MAKTVKEHIAESDAVEKIIKDANGLVLKLQAELATTRETLEKLVAYQHPELRMLPPYALRDSRTSDKQVTPRAVIAKQVERINTLLGDRA